MNNSASPNSGTPPLKIPHRESMEASEPASQTATQRELAADMEALRERETNLREYEARLRAWQTQLDSRTAQPGSGSDSPFVHSLSQMPFSSDSLLASSWEKFHRARALLESEQKQMRDERMMMREAELSMKRREAELAVREEMLAKREKDLAASAPAAPAENKKSQSAVERLTKAPFLAARSVFKSDK